MGKLVELTIIQIYFFFFFVFVVVAVFVFCCFIVYLFVGLFIYLFIMINFGGSNNYHLAVNRYEIKYGSIDDDEHGIY